MHKVGTKLWPDIVKNVKNENTHSRTWIMERNLKNVENETQTLYELEYGEKTGKRGK